MEFFIEKNLMLFSFSSGVQGDLRMYQWYVQQALYLMVK